MSRYAKQSGALHEVTERYAKVNGVWQQVTARYVKQNGAWNQVYSSGKKLSDLPVGSLLKINESGVPQQYIIVNQGNPDASIYDASCNGTWVLREEIYNNQVLDYGTGYDYSTFPINTYFNTTFKDLLNVSPKLVKIPWADGHDPSVIHTGGDGLSVYAFLLSGYEVGYTQQASTYIPIDGIKLSYFGYFTDESSYDGRVAYLNGTATEWWLRSRYLVGSNFWYIQTNGQMGKKSTAFSLGIRPAMILNSTALVSSSPDSDNCYTLQ